MAPVLFWGVTSRQCWGRAAAALGSCPPSFWSPLDTSSWAPAWGLLVGACIQGQVWGSRRVLAVGWEGRRWFSRAGGLGAALCGTSGECGPEASRPAQR